MDVSIYIPSKELKAKRNAVNECYKETTKRTLARYIEQEFPRLSRQQTSCYSIPSDYKIHGKPQASHAEQMVFDRLKAIQLPGLYMVFFHSMSYAGRAATEKLINREHDFVVFTKYKNRHQMILIEVKCSADMQHPDVEAVGNRKSIKDNKRTAAHQIRDHLKILKTDGHLTPAQLDSIGHYIAWPYLSAWTKVSSGARIHRWQAEQGTHIFSDVVENQNKFTEWFAEHCLEECGHINPDVWIHLLYRYVLLSCGVLMSEIKHRQRDVFALLSQEQLKVMHTRVLKDENGKVKPVVVYGPAGCGKTLLAVKQLERLHRLGELSETSRALYVCYWSGIREDVTKKLARLGIGEYVDTQWYGMATDNFVQWLQKKRSGYKHVFIDEAEVLTLSFCDVIPQETVEQISRVYELGNQDRLQDSNIPPGVFWYLVDINQTYLTGQNWAAEFLLKPTFTLKYVYRTTRNIFKAFRIFFDIPQFPTNSCDNSGFSNVIRIAHEVDGPPVYWVNSEEFNSNLVDASVAVVVDLCARKGVNPNDIALVPYYYNHKFSVTDLNAKIRAYYSDSKFIPECISNIERFKEEQKPYNFCMCWSLRLKGLDIEVVVLLIEEDDVDMEDVFDRRHIYTMVTRCCCLLIVVTPEMVKCKLDRNNLFEDYPFSSTINEMLFRPRSET